MDQLHLCGLQATKLCQEYGPPITIPAEDAGDSPRTFYGFPVMEDLAQDGVEETLRRLGFGYRAKYIAKTAKMIQAMDHGEHWLRGLRNLPYEEAHSALMTLQGVGPKVADCIVSIHQFFFSQKYPSHLDDRPGWFVFDASPHSFLHASA